MSTNTDAADQVVSMSLQGIKIIAEISGAGAQNLATYLYAVLKDQKKTKGKTRLEGMLKSGKELKVFAVKSEDIPRFTKEANRYGVLYCALRDKNDKDGMCDIMVRAEDAAKINRIVERFNLATVDTAIIKNEIEKSKAEKIAPIKDTPADKDVDAFIDALMGNKEPVSDKVVASNPTTAVMEKSNLSEPSSTYKKTSRGAIVEPERKSIRQQLRDIKSEQKDNADPLNASIQDKTKKYEPKHIVGNEIAQTKKKPKKERT